MAATSGSEAGATVDGRRARRERGRTSVIDATLALVFEGCIPPSVDQVAERAGVSAASVFRYFDTLEDLRRATSDVFFERNAHLFDIPEIGEGTQATRIDHFVSSRITLYETNEPMARLVRLRSYDHASAVELLHQLRATRAEQIRRHFDEELKALPPAARDDLVMIVSTLTSFESWEQAHHDHERSPAQLRRAWASALSRLMAPADADQLFKNAGSSQVRNS